MLKHAQIKCFFTKSETWEVGKKLRIPIADESKKYMKLKYIFFFKIMNVNFFLKKKATLRTITIQITCNNHANYI